MLSMLVLHSFAFVMFGSGYDVGSQAALIFSSHFWREAMIDFNLVAPTFVLFPLQDKSEALPPPTSMTLLAMGPKSPFLPDFFPPVLLYLLILFCCIKKLVILLFTIFISFTAVSKQVEFTALEHPDLSIFCVLTDFCFRPLLFFLPVFLFLPLFLCLLALFVGFFALFLCFLAILFCFFPSLFFLPAVLFPLCFLPRTSIFLRICIPLHS